MAVFVLSLALVWTVDTARTRGKVQRNVTLAGADVSGLTTAELQAQVNDLAVRFAATPVQVTATSPDGSETRRLDVTAAAAGLVVDQAATVTQTLSANRDDGVPFVSWLRSFGGRAEITPVVRLVEPKAEETASGFAAASHADVVEPVIQRTDSGLAAVPGAVGVDLDPAAVIDALRPVGYTTAPVAVQVPLKQTPPTHDVATLQSYVDEVNQLTSAPLTLTAGSASVDVGPETLRSWVRVPDPGQLELQLDDTAVSQQVAELLAAANTDPVDATVALQGDPLQPVISGGAEGSACCAPEAPGVILQALQARGSAKSGPVTLPMVVTPPAVTREAIEALGIIEPVATFTTRHACCEARVDNIHRMADLMQGYIIKPGEMLSINQFIGPRTADKGFVPAPAIVEGSLGKEIGGGISQYMTTLFNASWFAGLNFGEYSSHSIYISRYPYGREATVNYPHPDFQVVNKLPYGVLIQNSYDATSVTVTIWSTKMFASVEQTGQEKFPVEQACTGVRTFRTKTYLDGHQEVGATTATYRNTEGIDCDGSPGGDE